MIINFIIIISMKRRKKFSKLKFLFFYNLFILAETCSGLYLYCMFFFAIFFVEAHVEPE